MTIYAYIASKLRADTTLMAYGDIYDNVIAQGVSFPAMMMEIVSAVPEVTKENTSVVDTIRLSIHFIADSSVTTDAMAERARTLLEGNRSVTDSIDSILWADMDYDFDDDLEVHIRVDDYFIRQLR